MPQSLNTVPIPAGSWAKMARQYVPFSIRQSIKVGTINSNGLEVAEGQEVKAMQMFFDNGDEFRMFGSPEELWDQVKIFADFQGNNKFCELDESISYNNTFHLYPECRKKRSYICKNDIFLYIQNKLVEKEPLLKTRVSLIMLAYFLKSQEKKLGGCFEFAVFDEKAFDDLEKELDQVIADMKENGVRPPATSGYNWKKVFTRFKKLLPDEMKETEMSALAGVLKFLFSKTSRRDSENVSTLMYTFCASMIPSLQKIINSRPQWFLPYEKLDKKLVPTKPILRVFLDNNAGFVLTTELFAALKPVSPLNWKAAAEGFVEVIEWEAAFAIWEGHEKTMDELELVFVPIKRAKHSAVPIPTGTGLFCKTAADVLFELLRDLFFGSYAFQSPNKRNAENLLNLFNQLDTVFNPTVDEIYMLNNRMIDTIDMAFAKKINRNPFPKMVRDVSPNGFTAEDVRKELKHLTVDVFFSDVCEHSDIAYENVVAKKKKNMLRTCDLFDAIENCLMISVFNYFPKIAQFIHGQKACYRIHGLQCERCAEEKKNPKKKQHFLTFFCLDREYDENYPLNSTKKKDANRIKSVIKVDVLNQDELELIEEDLPEPEKQPPPKPIEKPKVKKEKESNCCEKCLRTSERCSKAKEELKASQKKNAVLEKDIAVLKERETNVQEVLEEKYGEQLSNLKKEVELIKEREKEHLEKIKILEKKVSSQQKEFEVFKQSKQAESEESLEKLRNANFRLTVKNEENERKIQKLMTKMAECAISSTTRSSTTPAASQSPHQPARRCTKTFTFDTSMSVTTPSAASSSIGSSSSSVPLIVSSTPSAQEEAQHQMENILLDLLKTREQIKKEKPIEKATALANKLIFLSGDETVKNAARYELDKVTREFNVYIKLIDNDIEMIKKNPLVALSKLNKIPDRPSFSKKFMEEYEIVVAKENEPKEIDDPECLICLHNMDSSEATIKCDKCKRRFHSDCAEEWLSQKSVCPTCDRKLLHPAEYPPL